MTREDKATREQRLRRFEHRTSIPLLVLSALFITLNDRELLRGALVGRATRHDRRPVRRLVRHVRGPRRRILLMVVGFGLFGLVAASLASSFIPRGQEHTTTRGERRTDLSGIADRLERIEAQLSTLAAAQERGAAQGENGGEGPPLPSSARNKEKPAA